METMTTIRKLTPEELFNMSTRSNTVLARVRLLLTDLAVDEALYIPASEIKHVSVRAAVNKINAEQRVMYKAIGFSEELRKYRTKTSDEGTAIVRVV